MRQAIYFPGLNGVRFVAVAAVIVWHVEAFKQMAGLPNIAHLPALSALGVQGVTLFFVLSGFLITYLLLSEMHATGTVHVRKFYLRRILRIWPLYFLLVILGLFVLPHILPFAPLAHNHEGSLLAKLTLFAVMLPNVALVLFGHIPFMGPLWSIGVEEQFYLTWPVMLRRFARKPGTLLVGVVVVMLTLRLTWLVTHHLTRSRWGPISAMDTFALILNDLRFECMAIGGLAALALHRNVTPLLRRLFHPGTQLAAYAVAILGIATGVMIPVVGHACFALLFATALINIAGNPRTLLRLENQLCGFMGQISYGLYMFHAIAIVAAINYLPRWLDPAGQPVAFNVSLYALTIAGTTTLAAASFYGFESAILKLKERFAVVASTSHAAGEASSIRMATKPNTTSRRAA